SYFFQRSYAAFNSVIIWPGTSLVLPSSNAKLDGITLRIGLVGSIPYTISNIITNQFGQNITNYTGYLLDLISLLAAVTVRSPMSIS
ncbi:unnamed protein product, partial [Adineta steineri]